MSSIKSSLFEFVPSFPKSFHLCHAFNMCSDIKYLIFCLLHNFELQNIFVIEGHRGYYTPVFCVYLPQSLVCCLLSSLSKKCNKIMYDGSQYPPTIHNDFTDIMCTFVWLLCSLFVYIILRFYTIFSSLFTDILLRLCRIAFAPFHFVKADSTENM